MSRAYMDLAVKDLAVKPIVPTALGTVVIDLHDYQTPLTCATFRDFCLHTYDHGYQGTSLHRIIPGFIIQGGDVTHFNGTGGKPSDGGYFTDEAGGNCEIRRGTVSMVTPGRMQGGSQFFIHLDDNSTMRGSTHVFGTVTAASMEVLRKVEQYDTGNPLSTSKVYVTESGLKFD